ncbi:hypothetical protein AOLI_G00053330 [Acnodon oligacanthus]
MRLVVSSKHLFTPQKQRTWREKRAARLCPGLIGRCVCSLTLGGCDFTLSQGILVLPGTAESSGGHGAKVVART